MSTILIEVRRAKPSDATAIAATHDEAWKNAYQGVIPGTELTKLINRRGPQWWDSAIRKGSRIAVLAFGDCVAGYANYGRNRARSLYYDGEIYELYLRPEFQGLGIGSGLIEAAMDRAEDAGHDAVILVGDPEYYARFGFTADATAGLLMPGRVERRRFLAREFAPDALANAYGRITPTGALVTPLSSRASGARPGTSMLGYAAPLLLPAAA